MGTRLMAWVDEAKPTPKVIHFRGMPPELTGEPDQREWLSWPRLLVIEEEAEGVFLFRFASDAGCVGDTWHMSIEDAKHQAEYEYAQHVTEWIAVPPEVDDPVAFAFESTR